MGISQPIVDGENDMIGGAHTPLVLRIYGDDFAELRASATRSSTCCTRAGTADASIFQEPPIPQVAITADRDAAARYGINMGDIINLIQTAVGGAPVTQVYVGDRIYNVTTRVSTRTANNVEALGQLPLTSAGGAQVPLTQVANIRLETGENTIAHEEGQRQITIRVDNGDRALSEYLADAQQQIDAKVHFDQQDTLGMGRPVREPAARAGAAAVVMAMVMGIMLIFLFADSASCTQAVMLLAVVPLATLGGLISLHLRARP